MTLVCHCANPDCQANGCQRTRTPASGNYVPPQTHTHYTPSTYYYSYPVSVLTEAQVEALLKRYMLSEEKLITLVRKVVREELSDWHK